MFKPLVTVLMPVYNGERYLREAMDSIIAQTFYDFEFLIIDDGSTDNTSDIIHSYRDGRIRVIKNDINSGLVSALNKGIENAQGQYIARMDSDDISMPGRLFKQVLFMEGHPEIGVCGSWVNTIGEWYQGQLWELSTEPEEIKCRLLFCTTLSHPSVMVRKKVLETSGLRYDGAYKHAEDYKLWMELAKVTLLANIPEPLVQYRFNQNQVSSKYSHEQMAVIDRIRKEQLHALGIEPTPEEIAIHDMLAGNKCPEKKELAQLADAWICKLVQANELVGYYPKVAFNVFMNRLRTV
ncbi:MAG: glycosyl transferase family 2 [Pelosinus sp.]|jgi:glycosyltransferase involved in cell wall biosynthesis|nr:glycosyl transferase family 2 [Pelosinus sp.]